MCREGECAGREGGGDECAGREGGDECAGREGGGERGLVSCPRPNTCARKEGLVTSCTTSCSKLCNVARPIRSLSL